MNHPTVAAHAGRQAHPAVTAGFAAVLVLGVPVAAHAEGAPAAGPVPQTAQEQTVPLAIEVDEAAGATEAAGTTSASGSTGADEAAGAPGPVEADGAVDGGDGPEVGAPSDTAEPAGSFEPDAAIEPAEEAEPGDATEAPDAGAAAGEAGPSSDVAGDAVGVADGSAGGSGPAGAGYVEASLGQSESGELTLLEGEGYRYVVLSGDEGYAEWDDVFVENQGTTYVGPGVYLWVDGGTSSFTVPAQVDGVPVVGVKAGMCGLSHIDLSNCPELRALEVIDNPIRSIDTSGCPKLKLMDCSDSSVTELIVSGSTELEVLFCQNTLLSWIDLSQNHSLVAANFQNALIGYIELPTPSDMGMLMLGATGSTRTPWPRSPGGQTRWAARSTPSISATSSRRGAPTSSCCRERASATPC